MLVVIDSGVVSAAVEMWLDSLPFRAVFLLERAGHAILVSPALIAEYRHVLAKPDLVKRHGFTREEQDTLLDALLTNAIVDAPPRAARDCPDKRDQHHWDLLEANPEAILVTGEHALLRSDHFPGRVLSPRQFVERYLDSA